MCVEFVFKTEMAQLFCLTFPVGPPNAAGVPLRPPPPSRLPPSSFHTGKTCRADMLDDCLLLEVNPL